MWKTCVCVWNVLILNPAGHDTSPKDVLIVDGKVTMMLCCHEPPTAGLKTARKSTLCILPSPALSIMHVVWGLAARGNVIVNHSAGGSSNTIIESGSVKGTQNVVLARLRLVCEPVLLWMLLRDGEVSEEAQSGRHPFCLDILLILTAHILRLWRFGTVCLTLTAFPTTQHKHH